MKKRPLCLICLVFLAVQAARIGLAGAEGIHPSALEQMIEEENLSSKVTLSGTIYRIDEKENITALFLKGNAVSAAGRTFMEPRLLTYVEPDQAKPLGIGNRAEISGEAQVFDRARNPGNFDQRSYYRKQGIQVLVWADRVDILSAKTDRVAQFLADFRTQWTALLTEQLGSYHGGTMSAILLGEKDGLDQEMKKLYQKSGIGHILAISGLHMSFIGTGIYRLFRRAGLGFVPAGAAGGSLLILYTLMVGAGVSSLRALIMFLVRVGADMTGRDYDLLTSLALAAAIVCGIQPLYLMDAGFLLSFGSILGIAILSPVFQALPGTAENKPPKHVRILGWLGKGLGTSLSVNILLLGPMLYFYFEVPLYSVFLNLAVIPLMSVVMGAGLAGSALTLLSEKAGGVVLGICGHVLWLYDTVCAGAGTLPGNRFVTGRPDLLWLILYYMGIAFLGCLFFRLRNRREEKTQYRTGKKGGKVRHGAALRVPGVAMAVFAAVMAVLCRMGYESRDSIEITMLDVGQGDCIFIRGTPGNYLIDGGSSSEDLPGAYRIEPCLLANGVDSLDYVFATHGDEDHINGLTELLEGQKLGIHIRNLVLPPEQYQDEKLIALAGTAVENDTRVVVMNPGEKITGGPDFELTCLGPVEDLAVEPGNSASLVLGLEYGKFGMLFTGDVEGRGEEALIKSNSLKEYDVLKAAHHGSETSCSEEFLKEICPRATLISAGVDNRYGHPHEETLARLKEAGSRVYSTQQNGAITVRTDGRTMTLEGYL